MAAAMVSLGIATGFERRYGVLKRLGSTPLSRGGLLDGQDRHGARCSSSSQVVLVVVVGVALGWNVPGGIVRRARPAAASAPSRSRASACSWPARCARRRTSPPPTRSSSCCCSSAAWRTRSTSCPARSQAVAKAAARRPRSPTRCASVLVGAAVPDRRARRCSSRGPSLAPLAAARCFRWEE